MDNSKIALAIMVVVLGMGGIDPCFGGDFEIKLGTIEEVRNPKKPDGLHIEVQLSGTLLNEMVSYRPIVRKAVDDTGASLTHDGDADFTSVKAIRAELGSTPVYLPTIKLRSSARAARTLKELSGNIEFIVPRNDPASVVTFNPVKEDGNPIVSKTLEAAGVTVTPWMRNKYIAMRTAAMPKESTRPNPKDWTVPPAVAEVLGERFKKFNEREKDAERFPLEIGQKSVAIDFKDPARKIATIRLMASTGEAIRPSATRTVVIEGRGMWIYDLVQIPHDGLRVEIVIATSKSIVIEAFSFTDIPLP